MEHMLRQTHWNYPQVQRETDGLGQKPSLTFPTCRITITEPANLLEDGLLKDLLGALE